MVVHVSSRHHLQQQQLKSNCACGVWLFMLFIPFSAAPTGCVFGLSNCTHGCPHCLHVFPVRLLHPHPNHFLVLLPAPSPTTHAHGSATSDNNHHHTGLPSVPPTAPPDITIPPPPPGQPRRFPPPSPCTTHGNRLPTASGRDTTPLRPYHPSPHQRPPASASTRTACGGPAHVAGLATRSLKHQNTNAHALTRRLSPSTARENDGSHT